MRGTVTEFDEYVALGVVTADNGKVYPFHCVSLLDGTRTVDVGQSVEFEVKFRVARYEAVESAKI